MLRNTPLLGVQTRKVLDSKIAMTFSFGVSDMRLSRYFPTSILMSSYILLCSDCGCTQTALIFLLFTFPPHGFLYKLSDSLSHVF
jgi:hypothetical protein